MMKLLKKYIHLVLLVCILILAFKIRYSEPSFSADLTPPDSSHYTLSAYNLYHHHIYGIKFYGQYYPAKYPYGYPLLIIPFYVIYGSQPYNAVYCSLFFSLLSIVFAYLIGKQLGNRFTGLVAALFVALCPNHAGFSKYIMSETSSTFLVLFVCWLLLKVKEVDSAKQRILLLVLGIVSGFSVSVHMTNFLFIPPVLISFLLVRKSNPRSIFKRETIILFGIILALLPLLLYQYYTFGSPLSTGYKIWDSEY
ncbi:MAG: glycosyltransferase family 39 protein, partial [Candidatus Helarchaeota archaeon]|nr:glycosyltransferase family 39 protein [Candidatus Helarchaeota archaeon]